MQVVKKEEKEAKLKEFIATAVSPTSGTAEAAPAARTLTLLARSVDSPVALALSSLDSLLGSEGVTIRAIFASDAGVAALAMSKPHLFSALRIARNIRLLDAHEQLVTDVQSVWVGDTMRRDPAKRDAYESYCQDSTDRAAWGSVCFERLWRLSDPIEIAVPAQPILEEMEETEHRSADPLVVAALELQQIPAATRH